MERSGWQSIFNIGAISLSTLSGIYFLMPDSEFGLYFALGAFLIAAMFILNYWVKFNITLIFVVMILYMIAGLKNWPIKDGVKIRGIADLLPALLPFAGFVILAFLYWENRNRF